MAFVESRPEPSAPRPLISRGNQDQFDASLDEYFLASRSLSTNSVASLLLSASFGVNAILYAAWLGYLMGLWALTIQIAWSLSFLLLARYANVISECTSLHDFLGRHFGRSTRRMAALCSIVGLTYFVGWEVSIARGALSGFARTPSSAPVEWLVVRASLFVGIAAALAVLYSALFGRRADARANAVLNLVKSTLLVGCVVAVAVTAVFSSHSGLGHHLLPSLPNAVTAVGIMGLLTSLLFNISWQFVDNSSWQSLNSGKAADPEGTARDLRRSGFWTFVTVNALGTIAGALLRGMHGVTSDNVLVVFAHSIPAVGGVLVAATCLLILASMISLVDVIILAVTQALVVDVGVLGKRITSVGKREARIAVLIVGVAASWGVEAWVHWLGGSIFNFVYIVIIPQLSLVGPVLIALRSQSHGYRRSGMWIVILSSCAIGLLCSIVGSAIRNSLLVDGAGAVTVFMSLAGAALARRTDEMARS